jgi:hypothetical protein
MENLVLVCHGKTLNSFLGMCARSVPLAKVEQILDVDVGLLRPCLALPREIL